MKTEIKNPFFRIARARRPEELDTPRQRRLFHLWNLAALLLSSALICVLSLSMAVGSFGAELLPCYLREPLLFLLNWLPVLLLQLLLYCLFGQQWIAFLVTALVVLLASAGNLYKLRFRFEPFVFSDFGAIGAAMGVAHNYDLTPNARILAAIGATLIATLLLLFLCRGRPRKGLRLAGIPLILLSCWPLWSFVYSSSQVYSLRFATEDLLDPSSYAGYFVSKGFVYPFLHSIRELPGIPPEGYDAGEAAELLGQYRDGEIPEDRQVNVIVVQLESFRDIDQWGVQGIRPEAYELWRQLKEESYSGVLAVNCFAGGTSNTERGVLAGARTPLDPREPYPSFVWYLRDQGYTCFGSHNYFGYYYNRLNVNPYLGFEEYHYYEDTFQQVYGEPTPFENSDRLFFAELLKQYREKEQTGQPLFFFNVTLQGHYPYSTDRVYYQGFLEPDTYPQELQTAVDNYLGTVHDTQVQIRAFLDALEEDDTPVVVLLYGDHCPNIGDSSYVSTGLGVNMNAAEYEGFVNMYTTEYVIWANSAAKEALGTDFRGEGPMVSACYLMNVLFDRLGWEGSAFMQFSRSVQEVLPVVCSAGYYVENGVFTSRLGNAGTAALRDFDCVTYYQNSIFDREKEG